MSISRKLQRARARAMEKPQVKRAMADARKDFIAKFGREPLEGEPLIFDPDFDTPTPYTDEKMTAMRIEAMESAGKSEPLVRVQPQARIVNGVVASRVCAREVVHRKDSPLQSEGAI